MLPIIEIENGDAMTQKGQDRRSFPRNKVREILNNVTQNRIYRNIKENTIAHKVITKTPHPHQ